MSEAVHALSASNTVPLNWHHALGKRAGVAGVAMMACDDEADFSIAGVEALMIEQRGVDNQRMEMYRVEIFEKYVYDALVCR
jgi:hypothetical protein